MCINDNARTAMDVNCRLGILSGINMTGRAIYGNIQFQSGSIVPKEAIHRQYIT